MKNIGRYAFAALSVAVASSAFAAPQYFAATGSWYDYINQDIVTGEYTNWSWEQARVDAEARSHLGRQGRLATLTSAAEEQFLIDHWFGDILYGQPWLGGFRPEGSDPLAGWQWITGEPFVYTNWNALTGEPNDAGGNERFLGYISTDVGGTRPGEYGSYGWNDRSNDAFLAGYFIEYAAPTLAVPAPGVPALLLGGLVAAFAAGRRASASVSSSSD